MDAKLILTNLPNAFKYYCDNTKNCLDCHCHDKAFNCKFINLNSVATYAEDVISLVEDYIKKTQVTYSQDFLSKHPYAPTEKNGRPSVCRMEVYPEPVSTEKCQRIDCHECWDEVCPYISNSQNNMSKERKP